MDGGKPAWPIFSENRPSIGHFLLPRTRISHAGGAVVRLCEAESQVTDLAYTGLQATADQGV
jgi:hypothetical protein